MKPKSKRFAAREASKPLTAKARKGQGGGPTPAPGCVAKLDRLQGYCRLDPTATLRGIPDFKSGRGHRIRPPTGGRFQAYSRVHWFEARNSGTKLLIESERREAWLPPYRLTLYADDATGLLRDEVFGVLEVLQGFQMTVLELAFDFATAQMDRKFVRNSGLFGKSRPVSSVNQSDYWGSRRAGKRIQVYVKEL